MEVGDFVEHINKGEGYYLYLGNCKSKDINTGEWYDAAMYCKGIDSDKIFIRELEDFKEKFRKVEI